MDGGRNILQRVGTPATPLHKQERPDSPPSPGTPNMNMKQEGPMLVPPIWRDNLSLESIANDFLDSNVTGEVMNLDDFLKELQVKELSCHSDRVGRFSPQQQQQTLHQPQQQPQPEQQLQQPDLQRYNLIRPANIEALKEQTQFSPHQPTRPSIVHHVGKPPELFPIQSPVHASFPIDRVNPTLPLDRVHSSSPLDREHPSVSLDRVHPSLPMDRVHHSLPLDRGHHSLHLPHPSVSPKDGSGIPQASVRPQVRTFISHEKEEEGVRSPEQKRKKLYTREERSRAISGHESDSSDDDTVSFQGGLSSTVVHFSQDDLRLATIPGQEQEFDPASRHFSEEELKPQPIIRKRKKQFVPDELKNNKYWAKRCKNNDAAKRSREARRLKENQIAMRARFLEEENNSLKSEMDNLKQENTGLKQMMTALEEKVQAMLDSR